MALQDVCIWEQRGNTSADLHVCVCVSAVVGVLATDAVYTLWPQSALKNGVN